MQNDSWATKRLCAYLAEVHLFWLKMMSFILKSTIFSPPWYPFWGSETEITLHDFIYHDKFLADHLEKCRKFKNKFPENTLSDEFCSSR